MKKLNEDFFNRNCLIVGRELLGKVLVWKGIRAIITETESYRGADDPASHAFKGPTKRSQIMFGPPARTYVYMIYGMYYCLNIVSEPEGSPSAVLIRSLKLIGSNNKILNGPGKLCRELNINKSHNNINLITNQNYYLEEDENIAEYIVTPRIGIKSATDKLWRFSIK